MGQPLLVLFISILLANSIPSKGSRLLRQTSLIDFSNVDELPALLRAASPGTSFQLNVASLTLTQTLHFTSTDITFGGLSAKDRPILRCNASLASEAGILVDASGVEINNLVIEGCSGPVLRVTNSVAGPLNGSPNVFTLQNVAFLNNVQLRNRLEPLIDGGAMHIASGTRVTIKDSEFSGNEGVFGGAISLLGGASLILFDSSFTDNTASISGGAIFSRASAESSSVNSRLLVRRCTFNRNTDLSGSTAPSSLRLPNGAPLESFVVLRFPIPQSSAGGIYASNFDRVTITDSSFLNNSALTAGGALFIDDNRRVVIRDNAFIGNSAIGMTFGTAAPELAQGGALYVAFSDETSKVEIRGCSFLKNSAAYGGGIHLIGTLTTQASISDCEFYENTAALGGGGLLIRNIIQVPLSNVKFVQNSARLGGGLFVTNGGGVYLSQGIDDSRNCLFLENEALDGAGCCFLAAGTSLGQAVAFNLNRATRNGGALAMIESAFGASIRFQDSTFSNNSARLGGAVFQDSAAAFQLSQTQYGTSFLAGNQALAGGAVYLQPWSQVRNEIRITGTTITNNEALLSNKALPSLRRPLPSVDLASVRDSEFFIDNQIQSFACLPGGGGGICISLIPLLPRALLRIELASTRIVQNEANTGGGIMISSSAVANCTESCPVVGDDIPVTISLCSGIQFDDLFFTENEASGSGSAMILTASGVSQWTCPTV